MAELKAQAAMIGEGEVANLPPSAAADAIFDAAKAAADAVSCHLFLLICKFFLC